MLERDRPDRQFIVEKCLPNLEYDLRWKEYPTLHRVLPERALADPADPAGGRKRRKQGTAASEVVAAAAPAAATAPAAAAPPTQYPADLACVPKVPDTFGMA